MHAASMRARRRACDAAAAATDAAGGVEATMWAVSVWGAWAAFRAADLQLQGDALFDSMD